MNTHDPNNSSQHTAPMTCEQAEMELARGLFNDFDNEPTAARFHAHIERCAACREKLSEIRISMNLVHDAIQAEPKPALNEKHRQRLWEEFRAHNPRVFVLRIGFGQLAMAASFLVLAATAWILLVAMPDPPDSMTQSVAMNQPTPSKMDDKDQSNNELDPSLAWDESMGRFNADIYRRNYVSGQWGDNVIRPFDGQLAHLAESKRASEMAQRERIDTGRDEGAAPFNESQQRMATDETADVVIIEKTEMEKAADDAPLAATAKTPVPAERAPMPDEDESVPEAQRSTEVGKKLGATTMERTGDRHEEPADNKHLIKARHLPPAHLFREVAPNPVISTRNQTTQMIAIHSRTDSFVLAKQYLYAGFLPPPGSIRAEEFVNAVQSPQRTRPGSEIEIQTLFAPPRNRSDTYFLKIDILPGDKPIFNPMLRVDFHPDVIRSFRLSGYEDQRLADLDRADQSVIQRLDSGESATVLFELEIDLAKLMDDSLHRHVILAVRYELDGQTHQLDFTLRLPRNNVIPDENFILAVSAAQLAEALRLGKIDPDRLADTLRSLEDQYAQQPVSVLFTKIAEQLRTAKPAP